DARVIRHRAKHVLEDIALGDVDGVNKSRNTALLCVFDDRVLRAGGAPFVERRGICYGVSEARSYAHGMLGRLSPSTPFRQLAELLLGETQRSTLHNGAPNISTTVTSTMMLKHNPMARSIRNRVSGPAFASGTPGLLVAALCDAHSDSLSALGTHAGPNVALPLVVKAADRSQRKRRRPGEKSRHPPFAHPSVSDCSRTYGRSSDIFVASVALRCLPATAAFAIYSARFIRHPNCRECRFPDSPL